MIGYKSIYLLLFNLVCILYSTMNFENEIFYVLEIVEKKLYYIPFVGSEGECVMR